MSRKRRKTQQSLQSRRDNPYSAYWQHRADRLWSKTVKRMWGNKCAMCGSNAGLQSHHLIAKKAGGVVFRWDPRIGMSLCSRHHGKFGSMESAHSGHLYFAFFLQEKHPELWEEIKQKIVKVPTHGPYPKINYKEMYDELIKVAHPDDIKG